MHEFKKFLRTLRSDDLVELRGKIANGVVTEMINLSLETDSSVICPVCERSVDESRDLVLHFGPEGLRQKARFCGHDCLEYFLQRRKNDTQSLNKLQENEE